ncbi:GntR family transcriptional regulator [Microlunatus ginsengisoli]|uniref:GntR family transcriptional regulator n=1 Tax=Microlunatus ginsengisoli TaxID=363863 RepID=A0ABP7A9A8_9ACTN
MTTQRGATVGARHQSLREAVVVELRDKIIDGELGSGERVVERDLAAELEVSRIVIREAIQQLTAEGLLVVAPRRGAMVAPFTDDYADQLTDVRVALEPMAARRAAEHRTDADLRNLRDALDEAAAAIERRDLAAAARLNVDFHLEIVRCAHNPILETTMGPLISQVRRFFRLGQDTESSGWNDAHIALYEAIRDRDPERAARLAAEHIEATRAPMHSRVDSPEQPRS